MGGLSNDAEDGISSLISSRADDNGETGNFLDCPVIVLGDFLWPNKEYLMKDNIGRDSQTELQRIATFSCLLGNSLFGSLSTVYRYCLARNFLDVM